MPSKTERTSSKDAFLTVRVPAELLAQLQSESEAAERTVAGTIRLALKEFLAARESAEAA